MSRSFVGARLRALRLQRKIRPELLATAIGRSVSSPSAWERGTATPSLPSLLAIVDALEIDLDELICEVPGQKQ